MNGMMDMMKQAQALQQKMSDMQATLEELSIIGISGAGLVSVTLNGKGRMLGTKIDPSLLQPAETEILEDLLIAAHQDAREKMERTVQEKMKEITGGLPIPPGMNLF